MNDDTQHWLAIVVVGAALWALGRYMQTDPICLLF